MATAHAESWTVHAAAAEAYEAAVVAHVLAATVAAGLAPVPVGRAEAAVLAWLSAGAAGKTAEISLKAEGGPTQGSVKVLRAGAFPRPKTLTPGPSPTRTHTRTGEGNPPNFLLLKLLGGGALSRAGGSAGGRGSGGGAGGGTDASMTRSSVLWLFLVERTKPDRWDILGALLCVTGALIILLGPR